MNDERDRVLRRLEEALRELRQVVKAGVQSELAHGSAAHNNVSASVQRKLEDAGTMAAQLGVSAALTAAQRAEFERLWEAAATDRLRSLARGEPLARGISLTIAGTISVN